MKKTTMILLICMTACFSAMAQDTLTLHKAGTKIKYVLDRVDSVTFRPKASGMMDTLKVYDNGFPTIFPKKINTYLLSQIDSVTLQPGDTIDYTSISGFDVLVNAAYTFPESWYGKIEGFDLAEVGTDLWTGGEGINLVARTVTESKDIIFYQNLKNNDVLTRLWKQMYAAVNVCNLGIRIVNEQGFTAGDPRTLRSAELRFWRAFYYWNIAETWGGVHLTTEPFYKPNLKPNQSPLPVLLPVANNSPVNDFYDLIFSDLQYAINYLPVTNTGRITKPIAEAFLARMYLTRNMNTEARDLAKKVIDDYSFSLLPKYSDLWDMNNQHNAEVIWSFNFNMNDVYSETANPYGYGYEDQSLGRGRNNTHTIFVPRYEFPTAADTFNFINKDSVSHWPLVKDVRNGNSFNRFVPTLHLLSLYDETKDARYKGSFQTIWYCNKAVTAAAAPKKFAKGDTAMFISKSPSASSKYFVLDYSTLFETDGHSKNMKSNYLCPSLLKVMDSLRYTNPVQGPSQLGTGNIQSFREVFVIRLSEMYLIAAEAEMNLGNQPGARDFINVVRRRAALTPALESAMEITQDLDIDFILDERARELAGEYLRWFDLKRTGKLLEKTQQYNPDTGDHMSSIHLVRPVPQPQLNYMKSGNLIQHPGY